MEMVASITAGESSGVGGKSIEADECITSRRLCIN